MPRRENSTGLEVLLQVYLIEAINCDLVRSHRTKNIRSQAHEQNGQLP